MRMFVLTAGDLSARPNQLATFVYRRYKDHTLTAAHVYRYYEMKWFLKLHRGRLLKAGLFRLTKAAEDPQLGNEEEVNEAVLRALCELPYTGRRNTGLASRSWRRSPVGRCGTTPRS